MRAGGGRSEGLDHRRSASVQHPPAAAAHQHDARARCEAAGRCRAVEEDEERRSARAGAAPLSDAAEEGRAGVPADHVGCGAGSDRGADQGDDSGPDRVLSDRARDGERDLLRGAESGARDGHQLDRQCGAHLPRPEQHRAQGHAGRGGDDLLLQRLDRHRSAGLHRLEPGEQSAGDHQVSALRQESRHQGGADQSVPRAGDGALLGAVDPGERGLRHEDCRPDLPYYPGRRYRVSERGAEAHLREGPGRSRVHRRAHDRLRGAEGVDRGAHLDGARSRQRAFRKGDARVRADGRDGEDGGLRLEHGGHPAHDAARRMCARSSIWR